MSFRPLFGRLIPLISSNILRTIHPRPTFDFLPKCRQYSKYNYETNVNGWKPMKLLTGLNRPARTFKPGEEDINNMPDEETRLWREQKSLLRLDNFGYRIKRKRPNPLDKRPQMKGIVLRTLIKKPKKPNSANRKCVLVRLSNGKEKTVFVPGIGHNLQEHSRVLVKYHRVKDVPGLKLRVIRGVYDCSLPVKQSAK